jgi:Ca2+-binding RTX toxin-like protein
MRKLKKLVSVFVLSAVLVALGGGVAWSEGQTYTGDNSDDANIGTPFSDSMIGQGGDDFFRGEGGNDYLQGDAGIDTLIGDEPDETGNDTMTGGPDDDYVAGGPGDDLELGDLLLTETGNDIMGSIDFRPSGGPLSIDTGNDTLHGLGGNDIIHAGPGNDFLYGDDGRDNLFGEEGNDSLSGGPGDDILDGGDDEDVADYFGSAAAVNVNLANGTATGEGSDTLRNIEDVKGSQFGDTLTGDSGPNKITGGPGVDTIDGGDGDDTINARDGEADTVTCGGGTDTVLADPQDTVGSDCENVKVSNDTTPPDPPVITSPANNSSIPTSSFTGVAGTAESGSTVDLFEVSGSAKTPKGEATTDSSNKWSVNLSGVAAGSHSYMARAMDTAGNVSGDSTTLNVTVTTPQNPTPPPPPKKKKKKKKHHH